MQGLDGARLLGARVLAGLGLIEGRTRPLASGVPFQLATGFPFQSATTTIFADSSWHADGDRLIVYTLLVADDGPSVVTGGEPRAESVLLVRPAPRLLV